MEKHESPFELYLQLEELERSTTVCSGRSDAENPLPPLTSTGKHLDELEDVHPTTFAWSHQHDGSVLLIQAWAVI